MNDRRILPFVLMALASTGDGIAAEELKLGLPIACEPKKTCFIQSYIDHDAGPGWRDYACGGATYDKHNGTDFRVLSAASADRGVPVVASADGVVARTRDGETDVFVTKENTAAIKGKECGNAVIIEHSEGWSTQYCHLKRGSVAVKPGQAVRRGERIGDVGYSGLVEFAHVHLTVRRNDTVVDPFAPGLAADACSAEVSGVGLWDPEAIAQFAYAKGEIVSSGFTSAADNLNRLEVDDALPAVTAKSPALLIVGRYINLLKGDRLRTVIDGPEGRIAADLSEPLPGNKATFRIFSGRKLRAERWPAGSYRGTVAIVRDGADYATRTTTLELP